MGLKGICSLSDRAAKSLLRATMFKTSLAPSSLPTFPANTPQVRHTCRQKQYNSSVLTGTAAARRGLVARRQRLSANFLNPIARVSREPPSRSLVARYDYQQGGENGSTQFEMEVKRSRGTIKKNSLDFCSYVNKHGNTL